MCEKAADPHLVRAVVILLWAALAVAITITGTAQVAIASLTFDTRTITPCFFVVFILIVVQVVGVQVVIVGDDIIGLYPLSQIGGT
jgi:hypothetical protein